MQNNGFRWVIGFSVTALALLMWLVAMGDGSRPFAPDSEADRTPAPGTAAITSGSEGSTPLETEASREVVQLHEPQGQQSDQLSIVIIGRFVTGFGVPVHPVALSLKQYVARGLSKEIYNGINDHEGAFRIGLIAENSDPYDLVAVALNKTKRTVSIFGGSESRTIDLGEITLYAAGNLSGQIVDQDGVPLKEASISFRHENPREASSVAHGTYARTELSFVERASAKSNHSGNFAVTALRAGGWRIHLPGEDLELVGPERVQIEAEGFDSVQVVGRRVAFVGGRVFGPNGDPVGGVPLIVTNPDTGDALSRVVQSARDGVFRIYARNLGAERQRVQVGPKPESDYTLYSGGSGSWGNSNIVVHVRPTVRPVYIEVFERSTGKPVSDCWITVETEKHYVWRRLEEVLPGKYSVMGTEKEPYYVAVLPGARQLAPTRLVELDFSQEALSVFRIGLANAERGTAVVREKGTQNLIQGASVSLVVSNRPWPWRSPASIYTLRSLLARTEREHGTIVYDVGETGSNGELAVRVPPASEYSHMALLVRHPEYAPSDMRVGRRDLQSGVDLYLDQGGLVALTFAPAEALARGTGALLVREDVGNTALYDFSYNGRARMIGSTGSLSFEHVPEGTWLAEISNRGRVIGRVPLTEPVERGQETKQVINAHLFSPSTVVVRTRVEDDVHRQGKMRLKLLDPDIVDVLEQDSNEGVASFERVFTGDYAVEFQSSTGVTMTSKDPITVSAGTNMEVVIDEWEVVREQRRVRE